MGDGDPTTSDGIFVFNGNDDSVGLGDVVRVTGTAAEFQDQTQISASSVVDCGTATLEPVQVELPFPSAGRLERYEGMLVELPQTLYVTEYFQLGASARWSCPLATGWVSPQTSPSRALRPSRCRPPTT